MVMIEVSRSIRSLSQDIIIINQLPISLANTIKNNASPNLLDAVAEAALISTLTERVFAHFDANFADICARWLISYNRQPSSSQLVIITSAFARILPFAPYLTAFISTPAQSSVSPTSDSPLELCLEPLEPRLVQEDENLLYQRLLSIWRLLCFDRPKFMSLAPLPLIQELFTHHGRAIRYLAIRIACVLLQASDYKLEALLDTHVGSDDAVPGEVDGALVDLHFLSLQEYARVSYISQYRENMSWSTEPHTEEPCWQETTAFVLTYGGCAIPKPYGQTRDSSKLVLTSTTTKNLESFVNLLQSQKPVILHGGPGSGKTTLVHEVARQLGTFANLVTLHLNEQTDAKMLVGLYSTNSKPGSFQWRPGVLTTAVRQGRWVLIEDLDRAPTEVLSTLLPLIERRELLIASRGETIRAADGFRLIATVRTARGLKGRELPLSFVGLRFWSTLQVTPLNDCEMEEVVLKSYPILNKLLAGVLNVYRRLTSTTNTSTTSPISLTGRQLTLRDLLKWCFRLQERLVGVGNVTGEEPVSEQMRDSMFLEALDCFAGSFPSESTRQKLGLAIAEEMHLSRDRAEYYMTANIPPLDEIFSTFTIGRVKLRRRRRTTSERKQGQPFASTGHAKRLLEQIAAAISVKEPLLLVGETGVGKTTVIQQLADSLGHKLTAVNLSQQSEVGDLLGGFKPVNVRSLAVPLKEEFEDLFNLTGISSSSNQKYLEQLGKAFIKGQWVKVSKFWSQAPAMFEAIIKTLEKRVVDQEQEQLESSDFDSRGSKRRKIHSRLDILRDLRPRWEGFARKLQDWDTQISATPGAFAFTFIEGNLIKAVRNGDWVLLDEINLATPDTLESIVDLLAGPTENPFILLSETGELEQIIAHPDFRIFAAMNPATDFGKRDLPIGIRSRFTELYVHSPDSDLKDLLTIVKAYLGSSSSKHDQAADDIARLYLNTKRLADQKRLVDGANEVPHFSLRTLTRVLSYVNVIAPSYGIRRALYEGFSMGFLTLLNQESEMQLLPLIHHHLLDSHGNPQALLSQPPKQPDDGRQHIKFMNKARDRQYWLFQGTEPVMEREDYIVTPYVERNLLNLVRATSTRRFPILIQGPTSAGKTSMIEYLANITGNKFVRINNHEHTDLQEYLGTYVSGADGKLYFQDGLLVQAMRLGHWIVLDELNLAPTDVLEALNRLLDDNRELLIPETQETMQPHENFILFATQNPPGLYGGRKILSRAFRNRFLELHFDDIPENELEHILEQRSKNTSPPDCRRIVAVYKELTRLRQSSRIFEQKASFATLRDLFRWTQRQAENREEIAANGFMLLAERVRNDAERTAVKEIIERIFKVTLKPEQLYSLETIGQPVHPSQSFHADAGIVWTYAMRRLFTLVSKAADNNEPVLLVGETGCGKTSVCQLLAEKLGKKLHIVNAHQNTETGDIIGSQRPVRNRTTVLEMLQGDLETALKLLDQNTGASLEESCQVFDRLSNSDLQSLPIPLRQSIQLNRIKSKALFEWSDGALVDALKDGQYFLLDEISLADDSVLERLNSVLEPQRSLLLAEKGTEDSLVIASDGFQFFATMNPGGDFGKRELSPALRNRFTEIWVPSLSEREDIHQIAQTKLADDCKHFADVVVSFAAWFGRTFRPRASAPFSVREALVWVHFINSFRLQDPVRALVNGAATVFIDGIGADPAGQHFSDATSISHQRQKCMAKLGELLQRDVYHMYVASPELIISSDAISIGGFSLPKAVSGPDNSTFAFHAPTTRLNAMRVLRALLMEKPILIEGNPGVGKTTLIAAMAHVCGYPLTRINLSDQTDLMDLFGADVPVEGEEAGKFAWRDAPFLQAMQKGEWVLLDEMNLASQSVLEGLNACLDHRGEVYISELDQVFKRHPNFRLFAAQNPYYQGGGRKGLPSSFVNRFIVVHADVLTEEDLRMIAVHNFPQTSSAVTNQLIRLISRLDDHLMKDKSFGSIGGPWEFNLRDVLRWLSLLNEPDLLLRDRAPDDFLHLIAKQRFRTKQDRDIVDSLFTSVCGLPPQSHSLHSDLNSRFGQVGLARLPRNDKLQSESLPSIGLIPRLPEIETLMLCAEKNIPCILCGPSGSGKSVLLQHIAAIAGKPLVVFPLNADIDATDLLGGYEQADPLRETNTLLKVLSHTLQETILTVLPGNMPSVALELLQNLQDRTQNAIAYGQICASVQHLLREVSHDSDLGLLLLQVLGVLRRPVEVTSPRFQWLDGLIIKAIETGQWLVLDNANLCDASVLDRLNSLLEPEGFLSLNEHCGSGGEPRIVKPHPEFRVFLTTDPKYGELSRAMRNRSIEVYLSNAVMPSDPALSRITGVESRLQRLQLPLNQQWMNVTGEHESSPGLALLENLSVADTAMLPLFSEALLHCNYPPAYPYFQKEASRYVRFLLSPTGSALLQGLQDAYRTQLDSHNGDEPNFLPLHPLVNIAVSRLLPASQIEIYAIQSEISHRLLSLRDTVTELRSQAKKTDLSMLTRLQRSLISDQVALVAKDSTAKIGSFLTISIEAIQTHILSEVFLIRSSEDNSVTFLRVLVQYLQNTIDLANEPVFVEAKFQAHSTNGRVLLSNQIAKASGEIEQAFAQTISDIFQRNVADNFILSSGISMELLCKMYRPPTIANQKMLQRISELHDLSGRFDRLRWTTGASITNLTKASSTYERAYILLRGGQVDMDDLIRDLVEETSSLESRYGHRLSQISPFFVDIFEALRQLRTLDIVSNSHTNPLGDGSEQCHNSVLASFRNMMVLSDSPTSSNMKLAAVEGPAYPLQAVDYLMHQNQTPWDGKFMISLWSRLQDVRSVTLGSLSLLETEMPVLAQNLANITQLITEDPLVPLNDVLRRLLGEIFEAHHAGTGLLIEHACQEPMVLESGTSAHPDHMFKSSVLDDLLDSIEMPHLRAIAQNHFVPCIQALRAVKGTSARLHELSAIAWTQFALGAITLIVPDRVLDPQLRPTTERELLKNLHENLEKEIEGLRMFEKGFTGQSTNARLEFFARAIEDLGPVPAEVELAYRPEVSELGQLQAEFTNILKTAFGSEPLSASLTSGLDKKRTTRLTTDGLKENVLRLHHRLTSRFEAYEDITIPIANLLKCLLIGLSLEELSTVTTPSKLLSRLVEATPFASPTGDISAYGVFHGRSLESLDQITTTVSIEGLETLPAAIQEDILARFHGFYDEWDRKLKADQKAAAESTSLYRFRGSFEDDEELDELEFNELFPTYDDDDNEVYAEKSKREQIDEVRDVSIKLANAHKKLFDEPPETFETLSALSVSTSNQVVRELGDSLSLSHSTNAQMLTGTMLLMREKLTAMQSDILLPSYSFYTDSNLSEVRKLVALIHNIRLRFRELQSIDEIAHMQPLEDVVQSCDKVLALQHTEPLAKLITVVELLHSYVYEWQFGGWASRTYAVPALQTQLSDTIIRWRRLELSTWAKLFDTEREKCKADAYSWWFIAYQAVIAAPLSLVNDLRELRNYATSLIETLEAYFSNAIVGQFGPRLDLLRQLRKHMSCLASHYPQLSIIDQSVANFVDFYQRFDPLIDTQITQGRAPIERSMKDVLLMASWKDTNITALRESARKSHQKLFRVVRKFRAVLGQETKTVFERGIPDQKIVQQEFIKPTVTSLPINVPMASAALIDKTLPGWLGQHKRIANVSTTTRIMQQIGKSSNMQTQLAQVIEDYVFSFVESVEILRKETPSTLTEENKTLVNHLKTRKRILLAETLKDLRNMGFRHNLGQDRLAEQESLSVILSTMGPAVVGKNRIINDSIQYLYLILDIMPRVRKTAREHSEDLTSAEARRSLGFAEGLLSHLLLQRQETQVVAAKLMSLQSISSQLRQLSNPEDVTGLGHREADLGVRRLLSWARRIVAFAIDLLCTHEELGQVSLQETKGWLDGRKAQIDAYWLKYQDFRYLPAALTTDYYSDFERELSASFEHFRSEISQRSAENSTIRYILEPLRSYITPRPISNSLQTPTAELAAFGKCCSELVDAMLVAIERASSTNAVSYEEPQEMAWLVKEERRVSLVAKELHMSDIVIKWEQCFKHMQMLNLQDQETSAATVSLLSHTSPIMSVYVEICHQSVTQSLEVHRATAHLAYDMIKIFGQVGSQGFCSPQEKSDEKVGDSGQLEAGTGLGEGEGADDISKNIEADEDMSELAQQPNDKKDDKDLEAEKDAVDMADEDLEGEVGSVGGEDDDEDKSENGESQSDTNDMDEEAGDVDDLDPTAVDEKMWDGKDEDKAEKDQQGDNAGNPDKDSEQMATEEDSKAKQNGEETKDDDEPVPNVEEDDEENPEDAEEEKEIVKAEEELNKQEQTAQEKDTLALPEEMELDLEDHETASEGDDDDMEGLSDIEDKTSNQGDLDNNSTDEEPVHDARDEENAGTDADDEDEIDNNDGVAENERIDDPIALTEETSTEEMSEVDEEKQRPDPQEPELADPSVEQENSDAQNVAPSDVRGGGQEQDANAAENMKDDKFNSKASQQKDGDMGDAGADQDTSTGNQGHKSRELETSEEAQQEETSEETEQARNPFKKLGDALESWNRQQREIQEANAEDAEQDREEVQNRADAPSQQKEYQHLQNDDATADTQALGNAKADEALPLDESMAIEDESLDHRMNQVPEEDEEMEDAEQKPSLMDAESVDEEDKETFDAEARAADKKGDSGRSGVKIREGKHDDGDSESKLDEAVEKEEDLSEMEEAVERISATHISDEPLSSLDYTKSAKKWAMLQSKTHSLALSLTSQLRLVLAPSKATKMSGAFRTGKRLNIKRIIPYIASSYKRDKIWMRRAIPTKRTYQILLCVDDSKSMGESLSGSLAMESLVMVVRSLTMLESGQVGVLGFGGSVFTAHGLSEPFTPDAGAKILQQFRFRQDQTDVALLVQRTMDEFRAARRQQQQGSGSDLWQLALILSDGLTPSSAHDSIRRLLREAIEERIMIVFIIMDDTMKKDGDSVLDLKEAKFITENGESQVVIERYLDTFPFQYYLIVHHLEELPGALAGLLRTWFAETSS